MVDYECMCAWMSLQSFRTLCNPMNCSPPGLSVHGDSPGKNTGGGCHTLLQGIFLTQGLNCISCGPCIAGRFFTTEPLGKPGLWTLLLLLMRFSRV